MQDPPDINQVLKKLESKLPLCRVCLNSSMEYIELDSTLCLVDDTDITYFDAFQLVTLSQVELFDRFPKTLCSSCGNDLLNAFMFRKRVENADIILNRICSEETASDVESLDIKSEREDEGDESCNLLNDETSVIRENFLQVDFFSEEPKLNSLRESTEINKSWPSASRNSLLPDSDSESTKEEPNVSKPTEPCVWMCDDCGEMCSSRENLQTHRKHHKISDDSPGRCKECDKLMETFGACVCSQKLSEISPDSDKLCYPCLVCECKYNSELDLIDHIKEHKDEKLFNCKSCDDTFHTRHLLRLHTSRYHRNVRQRVTNSKKSSVEKKEKCPVCGKMVRKSFMEIHKEVHFGPRNSMCTECGKEFASRLALRTHSLIHKQSGQFLCHICNKICQTMYALKSHIQFKHIIDRSTLGRKKFKYQCEDCGLVFQYPSKLRVHQRKHNSETPYICPHCSRSYMRKDQFNIHMRYHNNDLPYKCDQCDKSYATKNNLSEHRKSVHENVTYSCDKCEQKFKSVTGLRKHKFVHTGYPYMCPICGLGQPFRSGIKAHLLRVHKDSFTEEEFNETFPVVIPKSGFRRPKI